MYRGVIQEGDILRCEDGNVSFMYRDARTGKMGVRTLGGVDFLWLVLQHVVRVHGVQPLPTRHFQATSVAATSSNRCKPLI